MSENESEPEDQESPLEQIVLVIEEDGNLVMILDADHDYTEEQMKMFSRIYLLKNPSFVLFAVILVELWIHEATAILEEKWESSPLRPYWIKLVDLFKRKMG